MVYAGVHRANSSGQSFGWKTETLADQALSELCAALRRLLLEAGEPSTRDIAGAVHYSHTTVAQVLNGSKCPKWDPLVAVVTHLGGDPGEFKKLWVAARSEGRPSVEFTEAVTTVAEHETQTTSSETTDHERRTVLRLTRTTARDGTRSEALEIFDRQLAQEWIKSYLQDDSEAPEDA